MVLVSSNAPAPGALAAGGRPLRDVVADAVRAGITRGDLAPGTRIREEQLAEDLGVSRVPVREALQRLASEGFLSLAPRRGATVVSPSATKALELMEVRRALEVLAVRRAAERRGGDRADALATVVQEGLGLLARGEHGALPPLTDEFHVLVAAASGNAELVGLLDNLRSRVRWMFAVDVEHRSERAWSEHAAICAAVLAGRAEEAAALMDAHVRRDEDDLRSASPA